MINEFKISDKNTEGMKIASKSLKTLQKNFDLVIMEGAGSPAEINLQKYGVDVLTYKFRRHWGRWYSTHPLGGQSYR